MSLSSGADDSLGEATYNAPSYDPLDHTGMPMDADDADDALQPIASSSASASDSASSNKKQKLRSNIDTPLPIEAIPMSDNEEVEQDEQSEEEDDDDDDDDDAASASTSRKRKRSTKRKSSSSSSKKHKKAKKKGPPSPTIVDGVETYSVNRIIAEDLDDEGEIVYLIKWDGYTGADTWEPIESIRECHRALKEWGDEKKAILALGRPADLVGPGSKKLAYPIYLRTEKKLKVQKRSFKSDQEWQLRRIQKAEAAELRRKDQEMKQKVKEKLKARQMKQQAAAATQATAKAEALNQKKESSQARKLREDAARDAAQQAAQREKLQHDAEMNASEPFYYVTADDTLLMTCLDSDEEEAWGVGASRKVLPTLPSNKQTTKPKATPRGISGTPFTQSSSSSSAKSIVKVEEKQQQQQQQQQPESSSAPKKRSKHSTEDLNPYNTMTISPEEWSDDDLLHVLDNRGEDAKMKSFVNKRGAEELHEIIERRKINRLAATTIPGNNGSDSDRYEFLVRWKPWVMREPSWEKESSLKGAQEKLKAFMEKMRKAGKLGNDVAEDDEEDEEMQEEKENDDAEGEATLEAGATITKNDNDAAGHGSASASTKSKRSTSTSTSTPHDEREQKQQHAPRMIVAQATGMYVHEQGQQDDESAHT